MRFVQHDYEIIFKQYVIRNMNSLRHPVILSCQVTSITPITLPGIYHIEGQFEIRLRRQIVRLSQYSINTDTKSAAGTQFEGTFESRENFFMPETIFFNPHKPCTGNGTDT